MKCEDVRIELPGLLFGEVSENERNELLKHLNVCGGCRQEWVEIKGTEAAMLELGDENPPADIVFVADEPAFSWKKLSGRLFSPGFARWGIAAALILIALWIAKPGFTVGEGKFTVAFGGNNGIQKKELAENLNTLLQQERLETLRMVTQLQQDNMENLRREYTLTLAAFARDLDRQRSTDLQWIEIGFQDLQRNSEANIMRTNMVIEDILKNASNNRGGFGR